MLYNSTPYLFKLEDTAPYAGLLLTPAEPFYEVVFNCFWAIVLCSVETEEKNPKKG